jgi:hypothetical protein
MDLLQKNKLTNESVSDTCIGALIEDKKSKQP